MQESVQKNNTELQFTGNWFIDAGILGFVNLMEEVYGWDLDELNRRLSENKELVYYGYFPFGYLFYNSRIRSTNMKISEIKKKIKQLHMKLQEKIKNISKSEKEKNTLKSKESNSNAKKIKNKIDKIKKNADDIKNKINKFNSEISTLKGELNGEKKNFAESVKDKIEKIMNNSNTDDIKSLIPGFELKTPPEHRNFFLYNPKRDLLTSFRYLHYLLKKDYEGLDKLKSGNMTTKSVVTYEKIPDSTISTFFYSPEKFPNLGYTTPLKTEQIENSLKLDIPMYVIFLAFYNAFQYIQGRNTVFYTNNLSFCYNTNMKIKLKIKALGKKQSILFVTWSSIIDEIIENKSGFSLENMYLIEFEKVKNQKILNVEYIGISKLHSSIIIDDTLRGNINKSIQFRPDKFKGNRYAWILEELIKGKPLYPIILSHTILKLLANKKRFYFYDNASLYSLAIEAKIKEITRNSNLFSDEFFNFSEYGNIANNIKKNVSIMSVAKNATKDLIQDENERKSLGYELLSTLKGKNKNTFVNILAKSLVNKNDKGKEKLIDWYLHKYIANNDKLWEYYALPIIMGLVVKND